MIPRITENETRALLALFIDSVSVYPETLPLEDYASGLTAVVSYGRSWSLGEIFAASGRSWKAFNALFLEEKEAKSLGW